MKYFNHEKFDLEERFFIRLMYLGFILSILSIIGNLIIGLPFHVNYKWFALALLMLFSVKDVLSKKRISIWKNIIFTTIVFVLLPIGWIYTGGYNYLVMSYVFLICVVICFLLESKQRWFFLVSELLVVCLLIFGEQWTSHLYVYTNSDIQLIDLAIQIPITFGAVAYVAMTYANSWREEHRELVNYGDLLRIKNEELEYISITDELTGVYNRRHMFDYLSKLQNPDSTVHIAMIDMDNFKVVNDVFGHLVGDQVICMVCDEIVKGVNGYGLVGRYGGDEFIVVLENVNLAEGEKLLKFIQLRLKGSKDLSRYPISFSCGLTQLRGHEDIDEALSRADKLLYEAKYNGKDDIVV